MGRTLNKSMLTRAADMSIEEQRVACYSYLKSRLSEVRRGSRDYWELVGFMQELANKGSHEAKRYMVQVDLSRAFCGETYRSNLFRLESGTPSISVKGLRRQLNVDWASANKSYRSTGSFEK